MNAYILALILLLTIVSVVFSDTTEVCLSNGESSCGDTVSNVINPTDSTQAQSNTETEQNSSSEVKYVIPKGANEMGKPIEVSFDDCSDRHPQCVGWAERGECDNNPGWMTVNCPLSCNNCHLRDPKIRCDRARLNISTEPIYKPGDLDDMFTSIERDYGHIFDVKILSTSPWVVTMDNFVSDEEIEAILASVHGRWERSTDTGMTNQFGETGRVLSKSRTSTNAWCRQECIENEFVQRVSNRIAEITRIPVGHSENFQILQYEPGQYYRAHHDSSERQKSLACGPRILTMFLYLSDVEEGGETAFPTLNLSVKPKKGRALLWPSILNSDPMLIDQRTIHEARPVIKGVKYAANAWIHLYDFAIPNHWGCTGTFDVL